MAEPRPDHATHDLELIARAAAGDLAAHEAMSARDQVASCAACADLAADLRALADATRTLPSADVVATSMRAPRDFRLTPADAARLQPRGIRGALRRLGEAFAPSPRIGGAMATLGLVGLLVASGLPSLGPSREAASDATFSGAGGAMPGPSAAAPERSRLPDASPAAVAAGSPRPAPTDERLTVAANPKDVPEATAASPGAAPDPALTLLALVSAALVALGLLLVAASLRRRRSIG